MKNIYIGSALFLIIGFVFFSCDDSFLDTVSTDTYNEANWWKTEDQAISSINGCYAVLNDERIGGHIKLYDEMATPNGYSPQYYPNLSRGSHNSGNETQFQLFWNSNYKGVGRVNNFLENIDRVVLEESLLNRVKGEAYFLRALFYSNLVNYYGGVPLILESPSLGEQEVAPRNSKEEVIVQMLNDLDDAIDLLPVSYDGDNIGRATKGAALSLKARVLLYESRWDEAAAIAKQVIDMNTYSLFPNYRDLFMAENENNSEIIFDVQYKSPDIFNKFDRTLLLETSPSPTLDLINSYLMVDGKNIAESNLYDPEFPFRDRDSRLLQTILIPGYFFRGQVIREDAYTGTGFAFKKYTSYKDSVQYGTSITEQTEINFILLRYADVLLMYAEAQNEAIGPDDSVYSALNEIRSRAGMPNIEPNLSKVQLRELIRLERRVEFANEALYYQDIKRWRIAENVMNDVVKDFKGNVIQERTFNPDRDYLWPIHDITIQQNPNLLQNPGY